MLNKTRKRGFSHGGVWLPLHQEATADKFIRKAPLAEKLMLPLVEEIGALPLRAIVRPGQTLKRGQLIAEPVGKYSLPLFSPAWGEMIALELMVVPWSSEPVESIVILPAKDEPPLPLTPQHSHLTSKELRTLLYKIGVVNADLYFEQEDLCQTVIVNGCELEPYMTSIQRLLEEKGKEILGGMQVLLEAFLAERVILVVTMEKEEVLGDLRDLFFAKKNIFLTTLPPRYPQDDLYLLKNTVLSSGEKAAIVDLQTTIAAYEAVHTRTPITERVVTVTGPALRNPQNLEVRLGTLLTDLVSLCDGFSQDPGLMIMGGPMRGQVISNLQVPVTRHTTGFVFFPERLRVRENPCIACGRCIEVCPQELYPVLISSAVKGHDWVGLKKLSVEKCLLCGTCSYVCPSHISHQRYLRRAQDKEKAQ